MPHQPSREPYRAILPFFGALIRGLRARSPPAHPPSAPLFPSPKKRKYCLIGFWGGHPPKPPPKMNFFLRAPSARPLQILFHPAILVLSLTCTPFGCRFVRKLLMELHLVSSQHFEKRKSRNKSRNARSSQESVFERTRNMIMVRPLSAGHVSGW